MQQKIPVTRWAESKYICFHPGRKLFREKSQAKPVQTEQEKWFGFALEKSEIFRYGLGKN